MKYTGKVNRKIKAILEPFEKKLKSVEEIMGFNRLMPVDARFLYFGVLIEGEKGFT